MITWGVEFHSHTVWSKDCLVSPEALVRLCQKRGVDKIAITDHNTAEGALALAKLEPERVIVGEEIFTTQGELLGYFMQETIPPGLTPEETIRRLRDQGAFISVSHPFDRLRKGAWQEADLLRIIGLVDAIETFNARCLYREDNERAKAFAAAHGLRGTAGSDAHSYVEYGRAVTYLPPFADANSLKEAFKRVTYQERYSPSWVHGISSAAKWAKKLGLRQRLWAGG